MNRDVDMCSPGLLAITKGHATPKLGSFMSFYTFLIFYTKVNRECLFFKRYNL